MKKQNALFIKICEKLSDCEYHAGSDLGEQFQLTRAGVWRHIKKLQAYGVPVQPLKGKGYQLSKPLMLLDAKKIEPLLAQPVLLHIGESVDSTNTYLSECPPSEQVQVCAVEHQTNARGRFGRKWYAPFAENIYVSLRCRLDIDICETSGLSLVVAMAICDAMEQCVDFAEPLKIKWPNDIFYQGKKLGGVLIDYKAEAHDKTDAVIGIGLNVNMGAEADAHIKTPFVSLTNITQQYYDRNPLVAHLSNAVIRTVSEFQQSKFAGFVDQFDVRDYLVGQSVSLVQHGQSQAGVVQGVDDFGRLLFIPAEGECQAVSAGDVTLTRG